MPDLALTTVVPLCLAALAAGWIDAVVGGGGLSLIPTLLLGLPNGASAAQYALGRTGVPPDGRPGRRAIRQTSRQVGRPTGPFTWSRGLSGAASREVGEDDHVARVAGRA